MVDYIYKTMFNSSCDKQWVFDGSEHTLTNDDLVQESLELNEGMCDSSNFSVGTYHANKLKVNVFKTDDRFINEMFVVKIVLNGDTQNPLKIGYYIVESDKLVADRRSRELIMYDPLYYLQNIDATDFFNHFMALENVTMKDFRDMFFSYISIHNDYGFRYQQKEIALANDDYVITFTSTMEYINAGDILNAILHFNGCNGMIERSGAFKYIYLPKTSGLTIDRDVRDQNYYRCNYEEYTVAIDGVVVRQTDTKEMSVVSGNNPIILEGNLLFFEKSALDLLPVAENIANKVNSTINFTPFSCSLKGNPCYECGDTIRIETDRDTITSIIVRRTLRGVQGLIDDYETYCDEKLTDAYNLAMINDMQVGYVGTSSVDTEDGETILNYAKTAWKLRSAILDRETGERYYTYLTKNKHFIVSNSEHAGHSASNDVTDECTIGSPSYPWLRGYFKDMLVNGQHVLHEGKPIELKSGEWINVSGIYCQIKVVDGIKKYANEQLLEFVPNYSNIIDAYKSNVKPFGTDDDEVTFYATTEPSNDISGHLVIEEYHFEEPPVLFTFETNPNIQVNLNDNTGYGANLTSQGTYKGLDYSLWDNGLAIITGVQNEAVVNLVEETPWRVDTVQYIYASATFNSGYVLNSNFVLEIQLGACDFATGTASAESLFSGTAHELINITNLDCSNLGSYSNLLRTYTKEIEGLQEYLDFVETNTNVTSWYNLLSQLYITEQTATFTLNIPSFVTNATNMTWNFSGQGITLNLNFITLPSMSVYHTGECKKVNVYIQDHISDSGNNFMYCNMKELYLDIELASSVSNMTRVRYNDKLEQLTFSDRLYANANVTRYSYAFSDNPKLKDVSIKNRTTGVYSSPINFNTFKTLLCTFQNDEMLETLGKTDYIEFTNPTNYVSMDSAFKGCKSFRMYFDAEFTSGYPPTLVSAFEDSGIGQFALRVTSSTILKTTFDAQRAFTNCKNLGIMLIYLGAYSSGPSDFREITRGCTSLETVVVSSVYSYSTGASGGFKGLLIGSNCNDMFNGCTSLEEVTIHGTDIDNESTDNTNTFKDCLALRQIEISHSHLDVAIPLPKTMYLNGNAVTEVRSPGIDSYNYVYTYTNT